LILSTKKIHLMDSESMEAFLYRQELVEFDDYAHMEHTPKSQASSSLKPDSPPQGILGISPLKPDSSDQQQQQQTHHVPRRVQVSNVVSHG